MPCDVFLSFSVTWDDTSLVPAQLATTCYMYLQSKMQQQSTFFEGVVRWWRRKEDKANYTHNKQIYKETKHSTD